jgi:hypothetical protein
MDVQWAPVPSQRYHWYAYEIRAALVQVPVPAASLLPAFAVPATVG